MPPVIIYLTGFRQNAGKTVAALGIISSLKKVLPAERIGYLKPVGQEMVPLPGGGGVDRDALIVGTFSRIPDLDLRSISPVQFSAGFTRRYLDHSDREGETHRLRGGILEALEKLAHKDVIVAEGTGHPGVGSIIRLSNAKVSNLMKAEIIFLSGGGIGRALDQLEVDLSYFFFKRSRVRGVIFNKLVPEKIPTIRKYITEDLLNERFPSVGGPIRILGYLPAIEDLDRPSMQLIGRRWAGAEALGDPEEAAWKVPCRQIRVVTHPAENLRRENYLNAGDIVILSTSNQKRSRTILRYHRKLRDGSRGLGGLILTGGSYHTLDLQIRREIERAELPSLHVPEHTAICEEKLLEIYESTKLQIYDGAKVERIEQLYAEHFELERFLDTFQIPIRR